MHRNLCLTVIVFFEMAIVTSGKPVKPTKSTIIGTIVYVLVAALVLGAYGWSYYSNVSQLTLLRQEGKPINGIVTGTHIVQGKGQTYVVGYTYEVAGHTYKNSDSVDPAEYTTYALNQPIALTYAPSQPSIHRRGPVNDSNVEHGKFVLWAGLAGILAATALLSGIVAFIYKWQFNLLSNGIATQATILACDRIRFDRSGKYQVTYIFKDEYGTEQRRTTNVQSSRAREVPAGAITTAYYMAGTPERSQLLQDLNMAEPAG